MSAQSAHNLQGADELDDFETHIKNAKDRLEDDGGEFAFAAYSHAQKTIYKWAGGGDGNIFQVCRWFYLFVDRPLYGYYFFILQPGPCVLLQLSEWEH